MRMAGKRFLCFQTHDNIDLIWVWLVAYPGPCTGSKFPILSEDWPFTIQNREGHVGIPSDDKEEDSIKNV